MNEWVTKYRALSLDSDDNSPPPVSYTHTQQPKHSAGDSTGSSLINLEVAIFSKDETLPITHTSTSTKMSNGKLNGKTILITGASAGIGRATALEFARSSPDNLKLVITARRLEPLEQLAKIIKDEVGDGVKVFSHSLDISDPIAVRQVIPELPEGFRDIDILINNAGLARGRAQAPDIGQEDLNLMIDTNILGLINMTQAVLPIMLARGEGDDGSGDIV